MTKTPETNDEVEKRLLLVSTALETATTSLETLVEQMRLALASASALTDTTNKALDENAKNKANKG